jgi:predicted secreted hydrolase
MTNKPALLFLACATVLCAQNWQVARPGYTFQFPRDHFSHPEYETEWWYYTGNLRTAEGHRYGFELTFFRQGTRVLPNTLEAINKTWRPDQLYLAHLALSDIDGKVFYHTERLNRAGPGLAGVGLSDARYWNGNWQVKWTNLPHASQELIAVCDKFTLRLLLKPTKAPVIQGLNGISLKGSLPGQASHYISLTRIAAQGALTQKSEPLQVSGSVWMDHEFFTEPRSSNISGWDWFAIQLSNNEELMLYRLRDRNGHPNGFSSGEYVDSSGRAHYLRPEDFSLAPRAKWQSPSSKASYPISWQIRVPSLGLELQQTTDLPDQELFSKNSATPTYWEGAVNFHGTLRNQPIDGVGYLEMTGYTTPIRLSGLNQK